MSGRRRVPPQPPEILPRLTERVARQLLEGSHPKPYEVLGPHWHEGRWHIGLLLPGARAVQILHGSRDSVLTTAKCIDPQGVFEAILPESIEYRLAVEWQASTQVFHDAQAYRLLLDEAWLEACRSDGLRLPPVLGAHPLRHHAVDGVRFAVWAPQARSVAVVGDFNYWDGRRHPMQPRVAFGVWELFVPEARSGDRYKYEIVGAQGQRLPLKADPVARQSELPPATASIVPDPEWLDWKDQAWMATRGWQKQHSISIYEIHAGSWQLAADGGWLEWEHLADRLIPYVQQLGFTHIELLPVTEHPFGGSWGYQPLGMYAPTARGGAPVGFARFVERCHLAGIGVILDWVSAHFPEDPHGLQQFDGTALYEHADAREGRHPDWDTLIYNYGRPEVVAYLLGSAIEWIERFHVDGIRVDAVASMLYRDYSRADGEWIPNHFGGRENLEAVAFLQHLNQQIGLRHPDVLTMAEESTAWPGVTAPVHDGGLGFSHKWNMGWMHDTLDYMGRDALYRRYHHSELTFGLVYAFSERYVLPLSHDEVVHGKGSLIHKMSGHDDWQRFASLRAYYGFMWAHPGSKLLFMGGEFGQHREWNHDQALDWDDSAQPFQQGLQKTIIALNQLLRQLPALQRDDQNPDSFVWLIGDDLDNSVFAFMRVGTEARDRVLVICNFTSRPHHGYRVGVPVAGRWKEVHNSDSHWYGGSNSGNTGWQDTHVGASHGQAQHLRLTLPPLATLYLTPEDTARSPTGAPEGIASP
ncbi:1,4-alpha-glucan branching protein GlgB [Frateuria aurantia]